MKLLAIIGCGEGSLPILNKVKTMNDVKSIVFGRSDSVGKSLADIFISTDIHDISFIVGKCIEYEVDGIMASSESTTEITAEIANKLHLPGNDITNGFGAKNKYVMRTRVSLLKSVKQPKFSLYSNMETYQYPVIVKALDSCSKLGVSIARNDMEMQKSLAYARQYSKEDNILIEEYIKGGSEYSVECLAGNGILEVVQLTEKDSSGPPHFTESGHHQPAALSEEMKNRVKAAAIDIMKSLGIRCGLAHLEIKIVDNDIFFIEIGARGGGDHISDILVCNSTDFDYYRAAIDCCLGRYVHRDVHNVAYSGIYYHCAANKQLKPLFDKASEAEWCIDYSIKDDCFKDASSNVETAESGYFIYKSNHKITIKDI